jgi:hypothetical protein
MRSGAEGVSNQAGTMCGQPQTPKPDPVRLLPARSVTGPGVGSGALLGLFTFSSRS